MRVLAQQVGSTTPASVIGIGVGFGLGNEQIIREIECIKANTTAEQCIVYMPFRGGSTATENRIVDITFGRGSVVRRFDPPLVKPADASLTYTGTTNQTLVIYGD